MAGSACRRRITAAWICTWLVACGLLSLHHRAMHPHVIDARGRLAHPISAVDPTARLSLDEEPVARSSAPADADHDACPLNMVPGAWMAAVGDCDAAVAGGGRSALALPSSPHVALALYLLAPKTSPPARC